MTGTDQCRAPAWARAETRTECLNHATRARGRTTPRRATPARRPGSVRRTTAITSIRPDGLQGPLRQHGLGRDVVTAADGTPTVVAESETHLVTDYTQGMLVRELDGDSRRRRRRRRSWARAPAAGSARCSTCRAAPQRGSLPYLLLDDVPGSTLVSGMAMSIAADEGAVDLDSWRDRVNKTEIRLQQADICAGWQTGGTLLANLEDGRPPVLLGPDAPDIRDPDDPLGLGRRSTRCPRTRPAASVASTCGATTGRRRARPRRRVLPRHVHRRRRGRDGRARVHRRQRRSIPTRW